MDDLHATAQRKKGKLISKLRRDAIETITLVRVELYAVQGEPVHQIAGAHGQDLYRIKLVGITQWKAEFKIDGSINRKLLDTDAKLRSHLP